MHFVFSPRDRITIRERHFPLLRSDDLHHRLTPMPASGRFDGAAPTIFFHIDRRHSGSTKSKPPPST